MHGLFPFSVAIFATLFMRIVVVRKERKMTTTDKIRIAMTGGFLAIIGGIYAFYAKRMDERIEAGIQEHIRILSSRVDSLETEETDE